MGNSIRRTTWRDERAFRRSYPWVWWGTLVGPPAVTLLVLLWVGIQYGPGAVWQLVITGLATFFLLGKFVILGGMDGLLAEGAFFTTWQLALIVLFMDIMTVTILVFHLGFLFRLPVVGSRLQALVEQGHQIMQSQPWMRRATFVGLVLFVMVPLAATGSVGGSILARLLGMSRLSTWSAVTLGNVLGNLLMVFGGEAFSRFIGKDNPMLLVGGILVLGLVLLLLNNRYRKMIRS